MMRAAASTHNRSARYREHEAHQFHYKFLTPQSQTDQSEEAKAR
jgi:hypothetical protein